MGLITITRREFVRRAAALSGLAAAGGLGALLGGCGGSAAAPSGGSAASGGGVQALTVILGNPTMATSFAYLSVAQELGYFKEEGLNPSFVPSQGTEEAAQQVGAHNAELGMPAPSPVIEGYAPGKDLHLKWIYTVYQGFIYELTVPDGSPIRSPADLKGKTIGVSALASEGAAAVTALAKRAGLGPNDYSVVAAGVGAQAAAAVRAKRVDALCLWDSADAAIESLGIKLRKLETPDLAKLFSNGMICTPERLKDPAGRKMLTGFCRALAKGTVWMLANPDAAVRIHFKLYPQAKPQGKSQDEAIQSGLLEVRSRLPNVQLPPGTTKWGWNEPSRWQAYEQFLLDAGLLKSPVDVAPIYTNEILDEVNRFDAAAIQSQAKAYVFKA